MKGTAMRNILDLPDSRTVLLPPPCAGTEGGFLLVGVHENGHVTQDRETKTGLEPVDITGALRESFTEGENRGGAYTRYPSLNSQITIHGPKGLSGTKAMHRYLVLTGLAEPLSALYDLSLGAGPYGDFFEAHKGLVQLVLALNGRTRYDENLNAAIDIGNGVIIGRMYAVNSTPGYQRTLAVYPGEKLVTELNLKEAKEPAWSKKDNKKEGDHLFAQHEEQREKARNLALFEIRKLVTSSRPKRAARAKK
jgi:hypothetical protein